jgi:hypothetical protein
MDCSATANSLSLALPEADQGTVGTDVLIRNTGSYAFTVTDFGGGNATTVNAGISQYFYLTDNSSANGVWGSVTFGAGMSAATAAALAGPGLGVTSGGLLSTVGNIIQVSSSPTFNQNSLAATYVWTGGAGTFNLPLYSTLSRGWYIEFRNNGTGALTITPQSPSTINGQTSIITNPGDSGIILFDANTNNYFTVGWTAPTNITLTASTYDVDTISGNAFSLVASAPNIQTYVALSNIRSSTLTVTLPNITQLYVLINNTANSSYNINFVVSGGYSSPYVLGAGTVATIVSDAGYLYPITETTTSIYYATSGSASVPSFSFAADHTTGLYLANTGELGITANGIEMMDINNTNTSLPQITTPASFTANNINSNTAVTANTITSNTTVTALGGIFGGVF